MTTNMIADRCTDLPIPPKRPNATSRAASITYAYLRDAGNVRRTAYLLALFNDANIEPSRVREDAPIGVNHAADILVVGADDPETTCALVNAYLNSHPTIPRFCLTGDISSTRRAKLLRAGYDELISTETMFLAEAKARVDAVRGRYQSGSGLAVPGEASANQLRTPTD